MQDVRHMLHQNLNELKSESKQVFEVKKSHLFDLNR